MKQIKSWAQYYVDLMTRLGLVRFSMLLAAGIIVLAVAIQMGVTLFLRGAVDMVDLVRSVFFGLLVTPWAVYFLSIVVDQLEDSRQRLSRMVRKLQEMRERDLELNRQLQENITQLNAQIAQTQRLEAARQQAIEDLENEVFQREKAQLNLEERTALLRSFIDCSPDLVYYRNDKEQFSGCNRAMEELTGRSEAELIGLTPFDVYKEDIAAKVVETDRQVFADNQSLTYEQWLEYPDGRKAYFELRKVPFFDRFGKRLGLLGFGRDITERKQYQDKIEKASRDKTTFISTISHELRTPLNGIVGLSRILLDTPLDETRQQQLKTIHLSAVTLGNIFNDIIDLDKLDRRRLEIAPAQIELPALLDELEMLSRIQAEQKGLYLHFDRDGEIPQFVLADGTRLRQVLWNLVGNAVKFTESGGVTIRCLTHLDEDKHHLALHFEVEDTGVGIARSEQEKIFALYYQVQGQQQQAIGTGIGLAVSRQLVQAMGGTLTVDSDLGEGACFTVELEVELAEAPSGREAELVVPPLDILLVEDVELNVTVACALLAKFGHRVEVARNGAEALIRANPDDFDLILLDIQLPDMTGFDIAERLLARYGDSLPPMVALTANLVTDRHTYLARGMADVIRKPLRSAAVRDVLGRLFGGIEGEDEAAPACVDGEVLDLSFLTDYAAAVGKPVLRSSVDLFEKMMPDYMAVLDSNMVARDQQGIAEEAHKIKGAAGSIGLHRIQQLAQQIQSPDLPAWWENVEDWIEAMRREYPGDLARLRDWLRE
ncbi:aerobic respiration two-component sensor histidine kinase ArcB [Aeromonas simiae]|uniref:aerobic respiration two-component sensor histidine kinase ArcB n=1 Tax=Aeromonas simiae TaxID=218936 RepID=UPI00266C405B|nr:aerobic respiration two-component sensor histidine kinase ArcB [Aeromonas simiae]MDO2948123.1 aerobic respiration two-component sensor histidine kinase ArcB [Aeromonas simiae]MDO2952863.1 aerobic respiration two-component sensor histidine kinase ArcB [Aeromonas simiae]MDO2955458.1 aerobic respiration two-component sensor histidine kinase ArcB [Aeromonas simiae]